jgi:hypothetical protein
MKQRDIDRWVNRQARMHRQASMPVVNWVLVATIVVIVAALLVVILKTTHIL